MKRFTLGFILGFCLFSVALGNMLGFTNAPQERHVEFDYDVRLNKIPSGTNDVNIWLPLIPDNEYQAVEETVIEPEDGYTITSEKVYGNKILHYVLNSPQSPFHIKVRYKVRRQEYSKTSQGNGQGFRGKKEDAKGLNPYLQPSRLVTISPRVRELAAQVTKGKKDTIDKAMSIYDYVFQNVSYDKTVPGWGNGDTERVCDLKTGNCTDFHSLFISLARASNIPARFVMGVPLTEEREGQPKGYHCWAEFYDKQLGWVPVDISEAWKNKSKYRYFFGSLDSNRLEFTRGRDIVLEPSQQGEPLNYFLYPYIEADGKPFYDFEVSFKFKEQFKQLGKR